MCGRRLQAGVPSSPCGCQPVGKSLTPSLGLPVPDGDVAPAGPWGFREDEGSSGRGWDADSADPHVAPSQPPSSPSASPLLCALPTLTPSSILLELSRHLGVVLPSARSSLHPSSPLCPGSWRPTPICLPIILTLEFLGRHLLWFPAHFPWPPRGDKLASCCDMPPGGKQNPCIRTLAHTRPPTLTESSLCARRCARRWVPRGGRCAWPARDAQLGAGPARLVGRVAWAERGTFWGEALRPEAEWGVGGWLLG